MHFNLFIINNWNTKPRCRDFKCAKISSKKKCFTHLCCTRQWRNIYLEGPWSLPSFKSTEWRELPLAWRWGQRVESAESWAKKTTVARVRRFYSQARPEVFPDSGFVSLKMKYFTFPYSYNFINQICRISEV